MDSSAANTDDAAARVGGDSAAEAAVLGRASSGVETSVEAKVVAPLPEGYKRGNAGTVYKLVESGCFEIADHTMEREKEARLPQDLIVTVTLPADAVRFHAVSLSRDWVAADCCMCVCVCVYLLNCT